MSMSTILPTRATHKRLPSDDDVGGSSKKTADPAASSTELLPPSKWKGKGKAADQDTDGEPTSDAGEGDGSERDDSAVELTTYPPTTEDDAESRRIEENLRRWEAAERAKRRNVRESKVFQETADNARNSWYFWPTRSNSGNVGDRANAVYNPHVPLRTNSGEGDELRSTGMSLEDPTTPIPHTPGISPTTPTARTQRGPFDDSHALPPGTSQPAGPVMEPAASAPVTPMLEGPPAEPQRPILQAMQSTAPRVPTVSEPTRTAPPRIIIPGEEEEEEPPPNSRSQQTDWRSEPEPHKRWWTEWMCGCREDKTEQQGGATNPFE